MRRARRSFGGVGMTMQQQAQQRGTSSTRGGQNGFAVDNPTYKLLRAARCRRKEGSRTVSRLGSLVLDVGRLRHHRDLRLLMIGQLISGMGRQVTLVALPYQLYVLTRSPLAIGALAVVQLVPLLAFSLYGGA